MAIQYPLALDDFTNPSGTDNLGSSLVPHATQHSNLNDAVEALEAKVGIDASTDPDSIEYRVNTLESVPTRDGWRDLIGDITPKTTGPGSPTLGNFRGDVRGFFYSGGDDGDAIFHVPHDYVPGTDLYLHLHWSHNGTGISGGLTVSYFITYAKGHQQASFPAQVIPQLVVAGLNITNTPQYRHRVDEIQVSSATPSGTLFDTNAIEVDGLILVHYDVAAIPSITGGSPNEPILFTLDLHYQSNSSGTLNKAPNFYA